MTLTTDRLATTDDHELGAMVRAGRRDALAEAFRRHSGSVFALALKVARDRVLAEEVTQEVFVRFWRRPDAYDPDRGPLRSFLLSHAHGRTVDLIRSEAARRTREERDVARLTAGSGPSIEEEVMDMETAGHVQRALETLAPQERDAIRLAYFGGHSYREVAALLDAPEGTVKSRIRSGLRKLGAELRDLGA
jgi:RNA polymerase sigma-70 factor (ECF subfamily)